MIEVRFPDRATGESYTIGSWDGENSDQLPIVGDEIDGGMGRYQGYAE